MERISRVSTRSDLLSLRGSETLQRQSSFTVSSPIPPTSLTNGQDLAVFNMDIIIQLPEWVRPGQTISPPLVVRLSRREVGGYVSDNLSHFFAFVSLTSADGNRSLAPPRNDLIAGNLSDSIHPLGADPAFDEQEVGFMSFPNIRIQQMGHYRLRVSLLSMEVGSSDGPRGATNLQSTLSSVVQVYDGAGEVEPRK